MGLSSISFLNMWAIMNLDQYYKIIQKGGPYDGALYAKKLGLVDHIVCSTHCIPDDIITIINEGLFEGITISFNALNYNSMLRVIEAAVDKNMGIVTMNSLGGGIIPQNPNYFSTLKESVDESIPIAALRFNASFAGISVVLSGMSSLSEVEENTKSFNTEIDLVNRRAEDRFHTKVKISDFLCTGCGYCEKCPVNISISKYMQSYNYRFFPTTDFLGQSMTWLEDDRRIANDVFQRLRVNFGIVPESIINPCINCKQCENLCTQHLPITDRLSEMYDWSKRYNYSFQKLWSDFNGLLQG